MSATGVRHTVRAIGLLLYAAVAGLWATGVLWGVGVAVRAVLGGPTVIGAALQLLGGGLVALAAGLTADRVLNQPGTATGPGARQLVSGAATGNISAAGSARRPWVGTRLRRTSS